MSVPSEPGTAATVGVMDPAQRRVRIEESGKEGVITMAAMGAMKDPMGTLNIVVTLDDGGEVRSRSRRQALLRLALRWM